MSRKWVVCVLLGTVVSAAPVLAGKSDDGASARREEKTQERAGQWADRLGVDEATAAKIREITAKYQESQQANRQAMKKAMTELKELVEDESSTDARIRGQLDLIRKLHREIQTSRQTMTDEIAAVVGPRKAAKILLHGAEKMKDRSENVREERSKRTGK